MIRAAQKAELEKTLWRTAKELRGHVDGWDFKAYVLGMLFYRFISENLTHFINEGEHEAGDTDFDYAKISDEQAVTIRDGLVEAKGFFMPPSHLFENVWGRAAGKGSALGMKDPDATEFREQELNLFIKDVFTAIEESAIGTKSEDDIKGLFEDIDVSSTRLGNSVPQRNKKLFELLETIGSLSLGSFQDNTIDMFGDAYEYLMGLYAADAGKSGGEYFTPQEVSNLLARLTVVGKTSVNKVYDPACGSGSLLLQFAKVLGKNNVRMGFYGQELNRTTYNLARINMFLHDINYSNFRLAHGDTLTDPQHQDEEPFQAIVSNPPYSTTWIGDDDPTLINDPRFAPAGVLAPKSKADLAFVMHMLSWLATDGTAAIVEFPGVLYRGGAEKKIRQYLVDNNYVDSVIQLPPDLFFGTSIATCIIVLKKAKDDNDVLFIDASKKFRRDGNKNVLLDEHRDEIVELFTKRENVEYVAHRVSNETLGENDYNLTVSAYVEVEDTREKIDIVELNAQIAEVVTNQMALREEVETIVAELEADRTKVGGASE